MIRFGVIGAGAWGTALASTLAGNGPVTLWAREAEVISAINTTRENSVFLPGIPLPAGITATTNLADIAACAIILVVVPAQHLRAVLSQAAIPATTPLVLCAKGIEAGSHELMVEVAQSLVPNPIAVLSGPSFAAEVAKGLPCAITLACADSALGERLVAAMARPTFRLYQSDDVVVFDAIHGKAAHLMGKGVANPLPMLLPAIALLEHVGQAEAASRLQSAISAVLTAGTALTADLGGSATTREMATAIRSAMR